MWIWVHRNTVKSPSPLLKLKSTFKYLSENLSFCPSIVQFSEINSIHACGCSVFSLYHNLALVKVLTPRVKK